MQRIEDVQNIQILWKHNQGLAPETLASKLSRTFQFLLEAEFTNT